MNKLFDHVYLINLPKRQDKLDLMKFKLDKLNIEYQIFTACDGFNESYTEICNQLINREKSYIKTKGAVGLILTYIDLLTDAINNNYQSILILEDDCNFCFDFESKLLSKMDIINFDDISAIYLGANQYHFDEKQQLEMINGFYDVSNKKWINTYGTYAIGLSKRFIGILLKSINLETIHCTIDMHIQRVLIRNQLIGRVIYPFLIMPDVTTSDIISSRPQDDFCSMRKYVLEEYHYISINAINSIRKILNENCISLRQFLWKMNHKSLSNIIQKDTCREIFDILLDDKTNGICEPYGKCDFRRNMKILFDYISPNKNEIILSDLFKLIEGSNSKFVFIVPSYNNHDNYKINIESCIKQIYPKYLFRMIYIDDQSTDDTYERVNKLIEEEKIHFNTQLFKQIKRGHQGLGRYMGFWLAYDDEILILLDGDDWLAHENVLNELNEIYIKNDILVTYGSHYIYNNDQIQKEMIKQGSLHGTRQFPSDIISKTSYRTYDWISTHLRTGYAKLFKSIKVHDLISSDGYFYRIATDKAEMMPVLEMADTRHCNTGKPLCVYNMANSKKHNSSYYHTNDSNNTILKAYRENAIKEINNREIYNSIAWSANLPQMIINHDLEIISKLDYESVSLINGNHFIFKNDLLDRHVINELIFFANQTNSIIATDIPLHLDVYNYINFDIDNSYVLFRINNNSISEKELFRFSGVYSKQLMLDYFEGKIKLNDQLIVSKLIG
jgi:glycosyltransferase involved in cell wall biosynthesis